MSGTDEPGRSRADLDPAPGSRTPTAEPPDVDVFRLLTVCTANRCRSPMAEVIAADMLAARRVAAVVNSSGLVEDGLPASPGSVRAAAHRGLNLANHLSRTLDIDDVRAADLIVTMERRHIVAVADLCLDAVSRTFTLRELADLARMVGPRAPDRSAASWIARAATMRTPTAVLSLSTDDDLADPMGGPRSGYRKAADQIEELLGVVFDALFPSGAPPPA